MPSVEDHCYDVVHKGGNHFRPQDSPKDGILAWQLFVVWIMWGASLMAKQRLQFDFDETAVKEIDELREATAMPNRAELIRQALRFLQWTLDETRKGGTLLIEKDGKVREVIFPFWTVSSGSRSSEGE